MIVGVVPIRIVIANAWEHVGTLVDQRITFSTHPGVEACSRIITSFAPSDGIALPLSGDGAQC